MPNYNSIYLSRAGSTQIWLGSDNAQTYREHLRLKRHILEKNGWIGRPFTYTFNSNGFRCDEFTSDPTLMVLGCSLTCGIALPVDVIWPELVARQLGLRCANLGQGGCSADTAFRLCHGWIDHIKPKIVIYMKPPGIRWEMLVQEKTMSFSPWWRHSPYRKEFRSYDTYVDDYLSDENNQYFNDLKNTIAIEHVCRSRGIRLLTYDTLKAIDPEELARDCQHPGIESHRQFAQRVIEDIQNG